MDSPPLTIPPPSTLPPLLQLPSELHLTIISFLPGFKDANDEHDLALLQLRRTNRYFRNLVPPPTHSHLLSLELVLSKHSVYACKFCLCLLPKTRFASTMLKGKTRLNGEARERRFCADCGFDSTVFGLSQRYCPSTRACVNGVDWVWCKHCKMIRKGKEADPVCVGLCRGCYNMLGCRCRLGCGKTQHSSKPLHPRASLLPLHSWLSGVSRSLVRSNFSYRDTDGDDTCDGYDFWEEQMYLVQQEDDD